MDCLESANLPPRLPVPQLSQTLIEYLRWIEPLISPEEFKRSAQKVANFEKGSGQRLQSLLLEWDASQEKGWLWPLWDNKYLADRSPLPGNVNFAHQIDEKGFTDLPFEEYCARIAYALISMHLEIVTKTFPLEKQHDRPLCMEQYKRIFGCCRIAAKTTDELSVYNPTTESCYFAVLYNRNIYLIPATDQKGNPASHNQLSALLAEVFSKNDPPQLNVGAFTGLERDRSAECFEALIQLGENKQTLDALRGSLFNLCIDQRPPNQTSEECYKEMLMSKGIDRWFEKGACFVIGNDYSISSNCEHSGFDGSAWTGVTSRVALAIRTTPPSSPNRTLEETQRLIWSGSPSIEEKALEAEKELASKFSDLSVALFTHTDFGRVKIRALTPSPDGFVQLAIQMAGYKIFGRMVSVYEAVDMRGYAYGRTDCVRPCNMEVLTFIKAYTHQPANLVTLKELAIAAIEEHRRRLLNSQQGTLLERHLFGLQAISKQTNTHLAADEDFFDDIGYKTLKYDYLSTSCNNNPFLSTQGYGPSVSDGLGVAYTVLPDQLRFNITCWSAGLNYQQTFIREIPNALNFLYKLFDTQKI